MTRRTAEARRKPAICAAPRSAASSQDGLVLASTPELERLKLLERQHERLLRDIAKRRASLETMRAAANQVLDDVYAQIVPLREEIESTVREVREIFEELLARDAPRRTQRIVRQVYSQVLASLPWELLVATQPDEQADASAPESGRRVRSSRDESEPRAGGAFTPGVDEEAGYTAAQPDDRNSGGLRALFKRLVTHLHPDKVQDAQAKAERTLAMKEVTQAYQAGDLARLLEIERTLAEDLLNEVKAGEVAQRVRRLISANEALLSQLRTLTRERKALRDSLPFQFDLRAPRRLREQAQAQAREVVAGAEEEAAHYRAIREFVERFARGKMSVRDFALGPQSCAPWDADALVEAMLEELFANEPVAHQHAGRGRRR